MSETVVNSGGRTYRIWPDAVAAMRSHFMGSGGSGGRGILLGAGDRLCEVMLARPFDGPPDFNASLEDLGLFHELFSTPAGEGAALAHVRPVGWYVAKEKGDRRLNEADLQLHSAFFRAEDLILVCEELTPGEFRLTAASPVVRRQQQVVARARRWPAVAAGVFVLVGVAAALTFRKIGEDSTADATAKGSRYTGVETLQPQAALVRAVPEMSATPVCVEKAPNADTDVRKLKSELAFEMERNRRLETTLEILKQRRGGTE